MQHSLVLQETHLEEQDLNTRSNGLLAALPFFGPNCAYSILPLRSGTSGVIVWDEKAFVCVLILGQLADLEFPCPQYGDRFLSALLHLG